MQVVGVDGCPEGWLAVAYDADAGGLDYRVHPSFPELLAAYPRHGPYRSRHPDRACDR